MNISFYSTQKGTNIKPAKTQSKVQKAGLFFFFPILMKEKEPAQLDISHHKILVWFLQVAEVKGLAMQSLGIQRKKLVRCSFTSSNSNGEWVKFIRFTLFLILSVILLQHRVLSDNRKTLTKIYKLKRLLLNTSMLTRDTFDLQILLFFFFFRRTIIISPSLKMPSWLIYETKETRG